MHLRESRTSKFSGLRQIYPPVTLKYPLVQKLIETPATISKLIILKEISSIFTNIKRVNPNTSKIKSAAA